MELPHAPMATIDPRISTNPQLAGILTTTPMPVVVRNPSVPMYALAGGYGGGYGSFTSIGVTPALAGGTAGGIAGAVSRPVVNSGNAVAGGGQIVVGSGTAATAATPANGAQPASPTAGTTAVGTAASGAAAGTTGAATTAATTASSSTPSTAATTVASTEPTGSSLASAVSGFGKANRSEPIKAEVDGASFGFPSFKASAKSTDAPAIKWGPGWKKVEKDGMWYMQHSNGVRAVPAVEWRITPRPADKVQTIKVTNGWGKRFPNGSVLVFDRKEGAYLLDPKGNKKKMSKGNHVIDGVKVRIFEASVVRTIDKDGKVDVFDSRGNRSTGTTRWNNAAAVGNAAAGASMGGGKGDAAASASDGGGKTEAGGAPSKGSAVGAGGAVAGVGTDIQAATELAREIIGEIQSGNVDPARLQSLVAQLSKIPSGILQAAGAAGTMTSDGTTTTAVAGASGSGDAAPPAAGTSDSGTGAGSGSAGQSTSGTTATGGGGTTTTPTPGNDANATSKELAAGTAVKLDPSSIPADLKGKQARFAQLAPEVQDAVAKAFGSDQGAGAFKPDRLVAFNDDGTVRVVDSGIVFLRHQVQVRGAGPGEDMVMTMKPGRQPGSGSVKSTTTSGTLVAGGGTAGASSAHAGHAAGSASSAAAAGAASGAAAATGGGGTSAANKIELFKAGGEVRHEDFGGLDGTYTWKSLPKDARAVILSLLRSGSTDPAAQAFASRTGGGWVLDPNAVIVLGAGFATFPNGLAMARGEDAALLTPPVGIPSPTAQPEAHDATRPPVAGGGAAAGGTAGTPPAGGGNTGGSPGTAPPPPAVADPGETGHVHG